MKRSCVCSLLMIAGVLTACATSETPTTPVSREQLLYNSTSNLVNYPKIADETKGNIRVYAGYARDTSPPSEQDKYPAQYLRIVHPADNSKMVAAQVASFIFRGRADGYSKYELKGQRTEVENQSIPYVYQPVRDYLFQQFGTQSGDKFFPFKILAGRFYLVYDSYGGDKESTRLYELVQTIQFSKIREDVAETKGSLPQFKLDCKQNGVKYTLPEWSANHYRLVHETAKQYAQNCANEVLIKYKANVDAAFVR